MNTRERICLRGLGTLLAIGVVVTAWSPSVRAAETDELEELLTEVGGTYAEAYMAPLGTAFGANQNSGLYHTARIPVQGVTLSFGVKVMGSRIAEEDQTFRRVLGTTLDETWGVNPGDPGYGEEGVIVMSGPTVFGLDDEDDAGTVTAYYGGLPIAEVPGIEGAWKTRTVPLFVPQATVGGLAGLSATVRWLPSVELSGLDGKFKLWGFGLAYNVTQYLPTFPLDGMVGFFRQELDLGNAVQTEATSIFLAASKSFALLTIYGGAAWESSSMDVSYTYESASGPRDVSFSLDGEQDSRLTLGASLNTGLELSAEVNVGTLTTYTAGLMFGF